MLIIVFVAMGSLFTLDDEASIAASENTLGAAQRCSREHE